MLRDNVRNFLNGSAKIYYTGKKFHLYFIPYFGKQCNLGFTGIRDLYLIKIARIGTRKEGTIDNDPNDLRIDFELQFVKRLYDEYKPHKLHIWDTFTDTTLSTLSKDYQDLCKSDTTIFNEGDLRLQEGKLTHIDCFAGPGRICTGLHAAGLQTLIAIEYIKSFCETYTANHPEVHVIHPDIRKVTPEQILPYIPENVVDLVTSGMPFVKHSQLPEILLVYSIMTAISYSARDCVLHKFLSIEQINLQNN